jgi:hypothetical protein
MNPIYELEVGKSYYSHSGQEFKLIKKGVKYALDCSIHMVVFTNIKATHDRPAGEEWVLDEKLFMKTFKEK